MQHQPCPFHHLHTCVPIQSCLRCTNCVLSYVSRTPQNQPAPSDVACINKGGSDGRQPFAQAEAEHSPGWRKAGGRPPSPSAFPSPCLVLLLRGNHHRHPYCAQAVLQSWACRPRRYEECAYKNPKFACKQQTAGTQDAPSKKKGKYLL